MDFKYRKFPNDPKNTPFPNHKNALRPVIQIDFDSPNGGFGYFALIDSGADYCIFHASIGEQLGLDIKTGQKLIFYGISGEPQEAFFHNISFKIGGNIHKCGVGFSYDMEKLAYGILGQYGFFDKWRIRFEYDKENVELKEIIKR
ncbi:MAG: hypothetical protein COU25_01410 [Candidatus Levybacteria bacterium CG10_big_fil_rev_8_21_14_0_10_35_13]|nr:MAG: hypothetical protein COU25_01410 [Candidatus Levybacteria bacterium CG10_big_fil_rev_8_21_14_0_10_35_13]